MVKTSRIPQQGTAASMLPPAGDWFAETARSTVVISGRASRLAPTVSVEIGGVHGCLQLAADPNESRVGVCLDVRTVTTKNPIWDEMLRVADPLRSSRHPLAHYVSRTVSWTGTSFHVEGELEMAGISTPLALEAAVVKNADATVTLRAEGQIDPRSAGIHLLDIPGARLLVPRSMSLSIAVIATRSTDQASGLSESRRFALAS